MRSEGTSFPVMLPGNASGAHHGTPPQVGSELSVSQSKWPSRLHDQRSRHLPRRVQFLAEHREILSPVQAREERFAIWRSLRKSKVTPSQMNRRKPVETLRKKPQPLFTDDGYAAVVRRACMRAEVEPWHPNQLRHTFATEVRAQYGIEAAQVPGRRRPTAVEGVWGSGL